MNNEDVRIMFVTPHLSTGGLPQYLLFLIEESLKDIPKENIRVIEYKNISNEYTIQKDKIKNLLGEIITLEPPRIKNLIDKEIKDFNPTHIHFLEFPEVFLTLSSDMVPLLNFYSENKTIEIIETTHKSDFSFKDKAIFPDKFIFVSNLHLEKFLTIRNILNLEKIPSFEVIPYPIYDIKREFDKRDEYQKRLGLDPNKFNILQVGLFTPIKNQAETISIAKNLLNKNVHFYFIGNTAPNFKFYHEELLKNLPPNCTYLGEKSNVEDYLRCIDCFIFPSIPDKKGMMETSPISLKEAISFNVPNIILYYHKNYDYDEDIKKPRANVIKVKESDKDKRVLGVGSIISLSRPFLEKGGSTMAEKAYKIVFEENSGKILFYLNPEYEHESTGNFLYKVQDINTGFNIMQGSIPELQEGTNFWLSPINLKFFDFINCDKFTGFKVHVYKSINPEKVIFTEDIILKNRKRINIFSENQEINDIFYNYFSSIKDNSACFLNIIEMFYKDIYRNIINRIEDKTTVLDIGANLGVFSIFMFLKHGSKNFVFVEPDKRCYFYLEALKDIFFNIDKETITFFEPFAISDTDEKKVELELDDKNTAFTKIIPNENDSYKDFSKTPPEDIVYTKSLSILLKELRYSLWLDKKIDRINIIKIDVEGHEYTIFKNFNPAPPIFLEFIDNFIIEFHNNVQIESQDYVQICIEPSFYIKERNNWISDYFYPNGMYIREGDHVGIKNGIVHFKNNIMSPNMVFSSKEDSAFTDRKKKVSFREKTEKLISEVIYKL